MAAMDELNLLERVFLRIGSADTDEQLETTLGKFLTPVLLKLASQQEGVRKKVMELLVHINKRVKSRPLIQLPIEALLAQYQDTSISPFVLNFTIIYIKMGFPRLDMSKRVEFAPKLVSCLEGRPAPQQDSLMQLLVPVLGEVKFPVDSSQKNAVFGLDEKPKVARLMLDFVFDVLLLPYAPPQSQPAATAAAATSSTPGGPPPGLSEAAYKRVTGDSPFTPDSLEKAKAGIVRFLGSGIFQEVDIVCHLVVGASDTRHSVATSADLMLKRITGSIDWNSTNIVAKLYSTFQGYVAVKGKPSNVKSEQKRAPASTRLRMKLFPYFLKSREAANQFPACVQIIFDCLYGGNTNQKLKHMAVQFVHHLCISSSDGTFNPIGAVLLSGMIKLIGESQEDAKLRSLAYISVGKIARRVPQLVTKDIALLQTFFDAMCKEDADSRLAVQESLSMMSEAFKNLEPNNAKLMEALIMQNVEKTEPQARMMAVQYAVTVFPSDHIPSRYVLLLACGDMKEDIYAEASKALRNLKKVETSSEGKGKTETIAAMPSFTELVMYIQEKANQRLKTQSKYSKGNIVLPFNPGTYGEILMYLRMCLAYNADVVPNLESTADMQEQAPAIAKYIHSLLQDQSQITTTGPISMYMEMIRQLLTTIGGSPAMYCMLEMVSVAYDKLAPQYAKYTDWIKTFLTNSKEDMREYAAQLYATLATSTQSVHQLVSSIRLLTNDLSGKTLESQHGSSLALGYIISQKLYPHKAKINDVTIEDMETDQSESLDPDNEAIRSAVIKIVGLLDETHMLLALGACTALGEIGRRGPLPLPKDGNGVTKLSLVDKLIQKVQATKEPGKIRERAAVCLGYMCVGQADFPYRRKVIEGLLEAAGPKQFELHLTIGEALVCASQGVASPAARNVWTTTEDEHKTNFEGVATEVGWLLGLLLDKYTRSANPHIRQGACIWLLALVRKCGHHSDIQDKLKQIQASFMSMLSENDEMTQDVASKGLGVVYEKSSKEQKDELVSLLVDTLTTGKRQQKEVTGDTQLFEEGALGKTPDGKGMSTYKELCSIANDLNQPDLIYKFMHLANHNAMWNSKKGAAFGFTSIAAQAGEQLAPYLHQIVPKLYRYQFDPNPRIQQTMSSIWSALVQDNKKTVDTYIKEILNDLIKNLTSNQWRVRESSCLAVNDLLRGRQLDEVIDQLPVLWETVFRVRDDIKESVRKAADMAVKTLSRVSIKICDPSYGRSGEQATRQVLPCLLKVGIGSAVQEVRELSLHTIMKISKSAGPLIKPHIPLLVAALLESLSGLEPQYLNYLSLHVQSSQVIQNKLDNARIAASKTSPMMESVNLCVQYVDESILGELIPRLTELIRSGIGLGTKVGCATFITSLTHQCPHDLAPYAGKLLSALLNGLNDRNTTVKKSFAQAIGYVVRVAKDSSVEKLIQRLKDWYLEKEEEPIRLACGYTLAAIGQRSPDILKRHAALALPLAFLAMHEKKPTDTEEEEEESSATVWEEVWMDATPGTEAGIRLYLKELVVITQGALESSSWHMKMQGATAMSTIADKLGERLGPPHLSLVLQALLSGLPGRTWTGKETLLKAISTVCVSCREALSNEKTEESAQPTMQQVTDAVIKECKKENISYKIHALRCMSGILKAHRIDRFAEMSQILFPAVQKKSTDNKDEDEDTNKDDRLRLQECAYESLGQIWPDEVTTQEQYYDELCQLLTSALIASTWKVEVMVLKSLNTVFKSLFLLDNRNINNAQQEKVRSLTRQVLPPVTKSLGNAKYAAIRTEAFNVAETICKKLKDVNQLSLLECRDELSKAVNAMASSDTQPELQDKATELAKLLNECTS